MGEKQRSDGAAPGPPSPAPERRSQSSHPASFPLYWRDWLSDPRLRAMSRDERGGFLDVLCFTQGTKTVGVYTQERDEFTLGAHEGVILPTGESHAIVFLEDSGFIMLKSVRYDPDDPDTFPYPVEPSP